MFKLFLLLFLSIGSISAHAENIELFADDGLEWDQKNQKIIMHKNATAKTQSYELTADNIEALYKGNNKKIYKIYANDNVKIKSATENITTDKMLYDIDAERVDLFSIDNPTIMKSSDSNIVTKDKIIYYKNKNYATADNAEIEHSGRKLFSDYIRITFENKNGKNQLKYIHADGNIKLIDGEEELYGDRAEYNPQNGFATVDGNVRFKKGSEANLSGGKIVYDMNTGIAKILPKDKDSKVSGVFSTQTTSKK
ncbi:MAG: hypothetical protein IJ638_01810 [Alphaproteobacteria bacterium]|nr:hypothetical protein [Alphaproteobacteria bacterium]